MRILVIAGFVLFVLSVTIPFTSLATSHQCASPTPPAAVGTPILPTTDVGNLFINEVLLKPHATWNCSEMGGTSTPINDTWVEIYNSQNVTYDLYGVHATLDSGLNTNPFYFPMGSTIAAHSFLVVFPRTDAGFLSSETSTLRLLISGSAVDSISLPELPTDTSYARSPDGSDTWQLLTDPTIGASNPLLQITATPTTSTPTITHTPSPTASHRTATKTPTPHASPKRSSGGSSKQSTSGTAEEQTDNTQTGSDSAPLVDGSQPTWNKMPVATFIAASPTSRTTTATSPTQNQPPSNDDGHETIRKMEMTLVAIVLVGSLIWCGKLFLPLAAQKQKE